MLFVPYLCSICVVFACYLYCSCIVVVAVFYPTWALAATSGYTICMLCCVCVAIVCYLYHICTVGGAIKRKKLFFFNIVRTSETPPSPPINLDTQNFSVKENFGLSQTPPPPLRKYVNKKNSFGRNIKKSAFFGYFAQFSAKTLLDWVRHHPPFGKKSKKI